MKKFTRLAFFAAVLCSSLCRGADIPPATNAGPSIPVGDLGRKEALMFQGNKTFTKEQILRALAWQMDYHLAAHPAGSLTNYLAQMERKISLGYQRAGFPGVSVKALGETKTHRIVIEVS